MLSVAAVCVVVVMCPPSNPPPQQPPPHKPPPKPPAQTFPPDFVGMVANSSEAEVDLVRPQIEALFAKIRAVGTARTGMRIVLDYSPSAAATTLFIDSAAQGAPMAGPDFFRALLRIWLGERPAQPDLKRMLLRQDEQAKE